MEHHSVVNLINLTRKVISDDWTATVDSNIIHLQNR